MLKVASALDDVTETLITRIIGLCIIVHRELGPGLLESIYRRAICWELEAAGMSFEVEKQFRSPTGELCSATNVWTSLLRGRCLSRSKPSTSSRRFTTRKY